MELVKKEIVLMSFDQITELPESDQTLLLAAKEATLAAYAPYSKFKVGCALLLANGEIIKGNNQENIAYPSGLCAERVAVFYAGATYPDVPIIAMAITLKADNFMVSEPIMSCGACLQSLSEYEMRFRQPIRTILQGETGKIFVTNEGTKAFLPFQFFVPELKQ